MDSSPSTSHVLSRPQLGILEAPTVNSAALWWREQALERRLTRVVSSSWRVDLDSLDPLVGAPDVNVLGHYLDETRHTIVAEWEAAYLLAGISGEELLVSVAAADIQVAHAGLARVKALLPEAVRVDTEVRLPVRFWYWTQHDGAQSQTRTIDVTSWADVSTNYAASPTRRELESLMNGFEPGVGGQLLLWHGAPGTGKTYALRALAWEWREWCSVEYVTDPEVFLGREPGYLLEVALHARDKGRLRRPSNEDADGWHLIVLEDTGELLAPDAKERSGQSLARLLNLVDGLVGQGLRIFVLITSNEPLQRIHPAVARPGRCAAQIEFVGMNAAEAAAWLRRQGIDSAPPAVELSLADLHAIAAGREVKAVRAPVGFHGANSS